MYLYSGNSLQISAHMCDLLTDKIIYKMIDYELRISLFSSEDEFYVAPKMGRNISCLQITADINKINLWNAVDCIFQEQTI